MAGPTGDRQNRSAASDGEAFVLCDLGHRHWGRYGAAGVLAYGRGPSGLQVLLQHRSRWSHAGGTWAIPGGAARRGEDPRAAALRELSEETDLDVSLLVPSAQYADDHGGWRYVTVVAALTGGGCLPAVGPRTWETVEAAWVAVAEVTERPLPSGFARSWPVVRALLPGDDAPATTSPRRHGTR